MPAFPRKRPIISSIGVLATFLPFRAGMTWDIALGRWLALCAHPVCAWRVRSKRARVLVVSSYFVAGYAAALLALLIR